MIALSLLLALAGCGDPNTPPPGLTQGPVPGNVPTPGDEGPALAAPVNHGTMHRGPDPSDKLMFKAQSADGQSWERDGEPLAEAASSPNLTVLGGEPVVIFVEHGERLAQVPLSGGEPKPLAISGFEAAGLKPDGLVVDPHVIHLGEGEHRLFFIYQPKELDPGARMENEVRSALSTDEGATWVVEPGVRFGGNIVDPDVVPLPDGRWRMFVTQDAVHVKSAISTDSLSWEPELGLRFRGGGVTSTVRDGETWRMYFHNPSGVAQASSADGLAFSAPTAPLLRPQGEEMGVESPSVLKIDGTWWMIYSSYEKAALNEPERR